MTHYYKTTNNEGDILSLITCNIRLAETKTQTEITETEYAELYAALPQPEEPETNEATEADYIESLESLGVSFNE